MDNAPEILTLLDANAPNYEAVALVIGYENGDGFVLGNDPNRLKVLEDAKGHLAGLVGITRLPNGELVCASLMDDLGKETPQYMQHVSAIFLAKYQEDPKRTKSYFVPAPVL